MNADPRRRRRAATGEWRGDLPAVAVLVVAAGAVWLGMLSLVTRALEGLPSVVLALLGGSVGVLLVARRVVDGRWHGRLALLSLAILAAAALLHSLPLYMTGLQVNGVVHRSLISTALLLGFGAIAVGVALYYFLGGGPHAEDVARYPLLAMPVVLAFVAYAGLVSRVVAEGLANLDVDVLVTPYRVLAWTEEVWRDGWPTWVERSLSEVGLRNHIAGTLLLMVLTVVFAAPIGVASGVFLSEYGRRKVARFVGASTTILRATSPFVLALMSITLVRALHDTWLSDFVGGYYFTASGLKRPAGGSFLLAAVMIGLLVVPVIARATLQGCRALPIALREGSSALGASDGYTLRRIMLPWALPNIITAALLTAAEAAGCLAVIMFIAGSGDFGVGPLRGVTSLTYVLYGAQYGVSKAFRNAMRPYQFTAAAVLLVITVGLAVAALAVKARYAKRYQGA